MGLDKQAILKAADWVLPPKIFRLLTTIRPKALTFALANHEVLSRNKALHGRHNGERCFILCNGPSVKQQDITGLSCETVFSVSSGYHHPDYSKVAPRYHCVPQITYTKKMTPSVVVDWFREMDAKLGSAELILDCQEWELVQKHKLFAGRKVYYVCTGKNHFPASPAAGFNLSGLIPRAQSVPIMALMVAIAMGFKEIYLLGADHDWFVKKEYQYFYERGILKGKEGGVRADGKIESKLYDDLPMIERLWSQYRAMACIAQHRGIRIFNATMGGMLDEFPRVRLEDTLAGKAA